MDKNKEIKKTTEKILKIAGFAGEVEVLQENEAWLANIKTTEASRLIGQHGQTLAELEQLLKQIFNKKFAAPTKFILDINRYRQEKDDFVKSQAREYAQRVKNEKRVVAMPPMNAYERRLVHTTLAQDKEVETFSEGEREQRKVLIRPKSEFSA